MRHQFLFRIQGLIPKNKTGNSTPLIFAILKSAIMRRILCIIVLVFVAVGCAKVPGEGGNSSIKGTIAIEYRLVLTNPATSQATVPGADEDVFIVYGDHTSPDDRVNTNYNGEFEFRDLRLGDYTIYVYSRDTTGDPLAHPTRMPITVAVEITDKKQVVDAGEMTIYDNP